MYGRRKDGSDFQGELAKSLLVFGLDHSELVHPGQVHPRHVDTGKVGSGQGTFPLLSATLESTADGILMVTTDGKIAGINDQFSAMWRIPRELLAMHDDEAVTGYVVGQLSAPGPFSKKVHELYAHPDAESHDVLEFLDGRTFERYSRPQKVDDKVVGLSGASVMSRRGTAPRSRRSRRWRNSPSRLRSRRPWRSRTR